jgi:nucleotide-binding universal stress UspA family protein
MQVKRVVVGVGESAGSLQALRYGAELARLHDAMLMPVHCWTPPGGELADRRHPCAELRVIWTQRAWERLQHAILLGIGGPPADVPFTAHALKGETGPTLTQVAGRAGDLLVIGAGRRGVFGHALSCKVARYCLANASCPVLAVPPPSMTGVAHHGLRGWVDRHRMQPDRSQLHVTDV